MGDGGLAYLLETFSLNNSPKLHHLDLTGNGITSDGICAFKKVAMAKKKTKALVGLEYLSLRRNPMKAEGAKILAHMRLALAHTRGSRYLELRNWLRWAKGIKISLE